MAEHWWTCQRVTAKKPCKHKNPARKRLCEKCGKRRPDRKRPAHLSALALSYEFYIEVNGGEHCGVCGAPPSAARKLDRDHEHAGVGFARGLLCHRHNRALRMFNDDPALLRAAAEYLERAEARRPKEGP